MTAETTKAAPSLCLAGLVLMLAPAVASAQEPITANDFNIDLVQGPVLGSGRIIGLGGAYTALAEGVDGAPWNPAAYGSRTLWELDWFEWELTAGILFPGTFSKNDFFNTGRDDGLRIKDVLFVNLGYRLQFGGLGLGGLVRLQQFRTSPTTAASFIVGNYGAGYQIFRGQVVLGFGARTASFSITDTTTGQKLVEFAGTGPEFGLLVRLADQPWRLGAAARTPVRSTDVSGESVEDIGGVRQIDSLVLPRGIYMPWEVQVGFALQLGRRPLNREWDNPEVTDRDMRLALNYRKWNREREQVEREAGAPVESPHGDPYAWLPRRAQDGAFWENERDRRASEDDHFDREVERAERAREEEVAKFSRQYVLLTAEALVTGQTPDGIGVDGFLAQDRERSGQALTVGVRAGVEGEPWAGRLKLRAGTYLEPSRFEASGYRAHLTGGFDLRLFTWNLFGILDDFDVRTGVTFDVAVRYFDWGFGVGFWH